MRRRRRKSNYRTRVVQFRWNIQSVAPEVAWLWTFHDATWDRRGYRILAKIMWEAQYRARTPRYSDRRKEN